MRRGAARLRARRGGAIPPRAPPLREGLVAAAPRRHRRNHAQRVYSTRDLLRELPARYLEAERLVPAREFLRIAATTYVSRAHLKPTPSRARRARAFQRAYLGLIRSAARLTGKSMRSTLREVASRSSVVNRFARITGDASIDIASRLSRTRRRLDPGAVYAVIHALVEEHACLPARSGSEPPETSLDPTALRAVRALRAAIAGNRHGL